MAKLTIEIEENEFALFDADVYLNGLFESRHENYTSEEGAYEAAISRYRAMEKM